MRLPPPPLRTALTACGCALILGCTASTAWPASAKSMESQAQSAASLHASFQPYRLGSRTTLQFEFAFATPGGAIPPPLIEMQLRYPRGVNFFLNNLGVKRCAKHVLEASGPGACPRDSVMGFGVVQTGVLLGATEVQESAPITILRAPEREGHLALLFFAEGRDPVVTTVIFSGLLLSAKEPFGGKVKIGVPLVETLPGAPYVSVLHLHATIGPTHLTYYRNVDGVSLAFKPTGILLPPVCPRRSFPFAAVFAFANGTRASARTTVRCPHEARRTGPQGKRPRGTQGKRRRSRRRPT